MTVERKSTTGCTLKGMNRLVASLEMQHGTARDRCSAATKNQGACRRQELTPNCPARHGRYRETTRSQPTYVAKPLEGLFKIPERDN